MRRTRIAVLASVMVIAVSAIEARAECNRACLTGFVDTYFQALTANAPGKVPLATNAKVTLNGRAVSLAQAFWDSAERTVYRFDIVNERLGDTGTEAVVLNADGSKTMYMVRCPRTCQAGPVAFGSRLDGRNGVHHHTGEHSDSNASHGALRRAS